MTLQTAEKISHAVTTGLATLASITVMLALILPLHSGTSWPLFAFLCVGAFATGLCAGAAVAILVNNQMSLWLYGVEQSSNTVTDLNINTQE
jgi:hypothetical protein